MNVHSSALLWVLLSGAPAAAQTANPVSALSGAESLDRFLRETRTLRAEFHQELHDTQGRLMDTASGTLSLKRPNRFLWDYREPFEQRVVADAEDLWIYDVELGQVTVTPLEGSISSSPAMLLSGDGDVRDGFEVVESFESGDVRWVELRPKKQGADFHSVRVGFTAGALVGLELMDALDQTTRIRFHDLVVNPDIGNESFRFRPPAGVDVIGQPAGGRL